MLSAIKVPDWFPRYLIDLVFDQRLARTFWGNGVKTQISTGGGLSAQMFIGQ